MYHPPEPVRTSDSPRAAALGVAILEVPLIVTATTSVLQSSHPSQGRPVEDGQILLIISCLPPNFWILGLALPLGNHRQREGSHKAVGYVLRWTNLGSHG